MPHRWVCELEEKERFWSELDEVMESIPTGERVVIGADFNGHVGEGNTGDEEVMGKFGVKERNLEGQIVVDFAKRMDMAVVNTYFQKREEHRVTYKSGGRSTRVDYILCRRGNLKEISDCKVVVGESVARQHRMVVCRMTLMVCKKKRSKIEIEKKTKWWKLKKEECCEEFRQKLRQALGGQVLLPDDWETTAEVIRETGRKVLGVSSGRRKEDKETWWWNEEVQDSIQRKRLAKKKWDMDRTEENRQEYKELQRRVKRGVSKAKQKAYDELYTRLDTREGEKDLYRLARQRDRDGKGVQQVRVFKDRDGRVLTSEESVQRRWKEYFEELMNEENEREKRVEGVNSVEQKVDKIRKDEVRKALKRMKSGKAVGPDDIPVEVWKCLGEAAVEFLASLFNRVLESERMPEEWRRSVLVPIFKNKGDVQSCSNYRGIKLMSHTMKLWERVVEARLRKVVEICEQQYGFMPRKSTTDAIFALRILMEKYRDGQRELHCVFVDLEKAYDRVPREELWYCMRKSGVAEKYVRVVQDMYERSRTVGRCAVGQTEEFNVEVGLHQGSALSPFLFAIVMDQLSEEVRQESPWTMMFADDIVICSESREQVEENLERWRFALERRGMKVSRSKTEYMCVNEREGSGTVRLQGEEVQKVQEFKYLGSTVQSNGECGKEVKKRVQAGWNGWRKVSGVLCDRKISARIKGKVYRTVVRPAMLYGLETVSLRKRQESELEVVEPNLLLLPTEPHHDTSAVSLPPIAGELNRTWCDVQVQSPDSFSSQSESVNTKRDILRILRGPESRLCDTTAMYLLNHEVVEANLQLLPTEPRHDTSAVSLESSHFKDPEDRLTGIQAVVPYHELLPTTSHDEPSAFVLPLTAGKVDLAWNSIQFLSAEYSSSQSGVLDSLMTPGLKIVSLALRAYLGGVTEYLCCNRMEASVIVALEDYVHTFKKVTCTYLRVTEDGQVDTDTWVTEGVYSPHSSQSNSEEGEERFSPEEVEVPFISCQLSDREVTDIGLKLPALRQAFATILSSDHNQNFLFLNGRKIVMRLAAANNQDTVRVQSAYEALIWFLRTSSNQESITAELSGANLHFNFVDVFYELLVFGYFCNGLAPETFEGGFLQRLMALISMWDLDVWEPAAGLYFTVLIDQLTELLVVLFSQPLELYEDPEALATVVLRLIKQHVQLMMATLEKL
ncbi:hypothetical protein QTP70_021852 [Hemibagrus guttatus]|uniref:ribonuclease H n=1 Tax=Hemibagrus guttatus TaxID=175788 RepID=A0AAE0UHE2_9TELE|nr:hypothetical protein QTP70_021852 [Hemibagrus guttatus]